MRSLLLILAAALGALPAVAENKVYDYFDSNRILIRNGVQAVLTCNGLFTSMRTREQVFSQELAYLGERRLGDADDGPYGIDEAAGGVEVGGGEHGPVVRAVFREGIGCIVLPPDMSFLDADSLPQLTLPYPDENPAQIPWPDGDLLPDAVASQTLNQNALNAAATWAFERESPEQVTVSLLVVHRGNIVLEQYAPGFDLHTRTRTWSTAKSIAATLIGMAVDEGKLSLDGPLKETWLPDMPGSAEDPRQRISLRHLLNMSSGLYPVDSFTMEYATGSGLAYWAGKSSIDGMRDRGLVREPGTHWEYENYDTLLAVHALKRSLGDKQTYLEYPRRRLLDRIGMRNTLLSTDRFGDFILSSQVYANARDLARFGLLYLNEGRWNGEQLISKEWINFLRTPAPAAAVRGNDYGGQWWLVPDARKGDVPPDAYSTAGNRGQYVIVAPSHDLVIVRRGLDYGRQGFDRWDLLAEVLKAFPDRRGGRTPAP